MCWCSLICLKHNVYFGSICQFRVIFFMIDHVVTHAESVENKLANGLVLFDRVLLLFLSIPRDLVDTAVCVESCFYFLVYFCFLINC